MPFQDEYHTLTPAELWVRYNKQKNESESK